MKHLLSIISTKTLLFAFLAMLIVGLFLITLLVKRSRQLPPEVNPTFGELLAPLPQTPSEYQKPRTTTTNLPEETTLPLTAGVYRQSPITAMQSRAVSLANTLGFKGQPQTFDNFLIISEEQKYMRLDTNTGKLTFNQPFPEYLTSRNQLALQSHAQLLAKQIALTPKLWENPQFQTEYFIMRDIHYFEPSSSEKATNATVHVFPTIEGKRVISGEQPPFDRFGPMAVDFDFERKTVILVSQHLGVDFSEVGVYPLKTKEIALQELQAGQAFIASIAPEGQPPSLIETIPHQPTAAVFSEVELIYYYDPNPDALLQPMYLFTGSTALTDGRKATISALLPAIDPQFLKQP